MRGYFLKSFLVSVLVVVFSTPASSADVTLVLSHFMSPKSATHARFIEPWARKVEADSGGRIKIEIYPSMTLGGKPPELYRQLRDGVADIVWTLPGYTPGVFPRSEVFELPTVHRNSAQVTNVAIQSIFPLIAEDFSDIKPILVHVHGGQAFHVQGGCFRAPAALRGKRLRTPNRTGGWMIEAWGAEAVGMPLPTLPRALHKGVVDGGLVPFEIVPTYKINELTDCSISGADDQRFGTAVFLFGMNRDSYNRLPADLRTVIDRNSGIAIAGRVGKLWDANEEAGRRSQRESGNPVRHLSHAETREMLAPLQSVVDRWIESVERRGIDGAALVRAARDAVDAHSR